MKDRIIKEISHLVLMDLDKAKSASKNTKDYAQGDDLKSEGKYDTRAIEASYLASAQEKRVSELEQQVISLETLAREVKMGHEKVQIGSLIKVFIADDERNYFLTRLTGGYKVNVSGTDFSILSVSSPLAEAMIGLNVGDEFEFEIEGEETPIIINQII